MVQAFTTVNATQCKQSCVSYGDMFRGVMQGRIRRVQEFVHLNMLIGARSKTASKASAENEI